MTKVILDTNFILNAIHNKLDFFEELTLKGHRVIIPIEVIEEIKRLRDGTKALKFREDADFALRLIKSEEHDEVKIGGRYVDVGLRNYLKKNPDVVLGTMDKELKKSVTNRKIIIRNKKKLELQ